MHAAILRCLSVFSLVFALSGPGWAIDGVVLDPDGKPIGNLQVRVFSAQVEIKPEQAIEEHRTGPDGRFRIKKDDDQPVILEVTGERGAGRVRLDSTGAQSDKDRVEITYPVRETIVLLHDNDHHFDFNSPDEFQKRVEAYRREHDDVFLLNGGDIFVRHPHRWEADGESFEGDTKWYRDRAVAIVKTMNRMGYDAMTLGNHELAHIETYTREALELAEFPLLATNVELTTDKLPPVERQVVLKTGTQRTIAVIGLTVGSGDGVQILNRTRVAAAHASLADAHDLVVALNHIGYKGDTDLAEKFDFFDVIIGAHSHTLLKKAELVNGVLVAQAGGNRHQVSKKHPTYLGIITLTLENGNVIEKEGHVITLPLPDEVKTP